MSVKVEAVYDVSIALGEESLVSFVLLMPPTPEAISEAAKIEEYQEVAQAVKLLPTVDVPDSDGNTQVTPITVAGLTLGTVSITRLPAYRQQKKRGRPKNPTMPTEGE